MSAFDGLAGRFCDTSHGGEKPLVAFRVSLPGAADIAHGLLGGAGDSRVADEEGEGGGDGEGGGALTPNPLLCTPRRPTGRGGLTPFSLWEKGWG
ncbi:MAG: hypothetical protein MAG431_00588 [Chloroflexi bacterium]|nr:hypothetical protein [Chloroflexota bacterium]